MLCEKEYQLTNFCSEAALRDEGVTSLLNELVIAVPRASIHNDISIRGNMLQSLPCGIKYYLYCSLLVIVKF